MRVPVPPSPDQIRRSLEQQALGEWIQQQKAAGRDSVSGTELDLVQQGIALGVAHAMARWG